jgi:prolyl oligopeptidase
MAQLYHTISKDGLDKQRNPLLASIDVDAGHGAGKPTSKIIEELAKIYAFVHRVLKIPYVDEK